MNKPARRSGIRRLYYAYAPGDHGGNRANRTSPGPASIRNLPHKIGKKNSQQDSMLILLTRTFYSSISSWPALRGLALRLATGRKAGLLRNEKTEKVPLQQGPVYANGATLPVTRAAACPATAAPNPPVTRPRPCPMPARLAYGAPRSVPAAGEARSGAGQWEWAPPLIPQTPQWVGHRRRRALHPSAGEYRQTAKAPCSCRQKRRRPRCTFRRSPAWAREN
jgi:hypothetical protein